MSDTGICGDIRTGIFGSHLLCTLKAGHAGWHQNDDTAQRNPAPLSPSPAIQWREPAEADTLRRAGFAAPRPSPSRDELFRAALDAYMCADPHPWSAEVDAILTQGLDTEARRRGFLGWVDAYHEFKPSPSPSPPEDEAQRKAAWQAWNEADGAVIAEAYKKSLTAPSQLRGSKALRKQRNEAWEKNDRLAAELAEARREAELNWSAYEEAKTNGLAAITELRKHRDEARAVISRVLALCEPIAANTIHEHYSGCVPTDSPTCLAARVLCILNGEEG